MCVTRRSWQWFVIVVTWNCAFINKLLLPFVNGDSNAPLKLEELPPPHSVRFDARTKNSLTLEWDAPKLSSFAEAPSLLHFTIHYYSTPGSENVETATVDERSKLIHNLKPATNYTVYITAHYQGNRNSSSPKFVVTTTESTSNSVYKDCSCSDPGTKTCDRQFDGTCLCHKGYEGSFCDACSHGYYRSGEACLPCPCNPDKTYGSCELGTEIPGEVTCTCHEGYLGRLCESCLSGYYPVAGDRCVKCQCLTCNQGVIQRTDSAQSSWSCDHCPAYLHNITDHNAVRQNCGIPDPRTQNRIVNHGDGTVAIVAAFVSLAFIACVAAGVMCYRRHIMAHNHPPFWSIELTEDKISLNTDGGIGSGIGTVGSSGGDYQRLGEKSSKMRTSHHQRTPSVAEATAAQRAADQPQYNCISI